jgi:hypothetical protein
MASNSVTKENDMTNTRKLIAKLALAVGLIGSLAFSAATPSLARSNVHYYEPSENGSVWSNYPGYTDKFTTQRSTDRAPAYNAFAQAPAHNHGVTLVDDPPGSAFQTQGNNDSMGCPC